MPFDATIPVLSNFHTRSVPLILLSTPLQSGRVLYSARPVTRVINGAGVDVVEDIHEGVINYANVYSVAPDANCAINGHGSGNNDEDDDGDGDDDSDTEIVDTTVTTSSGIDGHDGKNVF